MGIAEDLAGFLAFFPDWFVVIFISMCPFVELRLSIPVAIAVYDMDRIHAFILAIIGNIIPIPFILLFLGRVEKWLSSRYERWDRFFKWLFSRTRKRATETIRKYEILGLALYVAIPLPVTGAWTGALIAYVFGIDLKRAFYSITAGVLIAGLIVWLVVIGIIGLWGL